MGLTEFDVGLLFALSGGLWAVMSAYWGRKSDKWGRKPILMMGVATYATSMMLFTLAVHAGLEGWVPVAFAFPLMILARALNGGIGSGAFPAAQAYIADRTSRSDRTGGVTMMNAAFGVGVVFGPGVGALLVGFHLLAPLVAVALMAFASTLALALFLPESRTPFERRRNVQISVFDRRIVPFAIASSGMGVCHATSMQTIGFYMMDTLGLGIAETTQQVGISLTLAAVAALAFQVIAVPRFRLGPRFLVRTGSPFLLAGFLMLLVAGRYEFMVCAMVLLGLGTAMLRPGFASAASLAVSPNEQGSAAGLLMGTNAVGHVVSPILAMPLYAVWPGAPYILCATLAVSMIIYVHINPRIRAATAQRFVD